MQKFVIKTLIIILAIAAFYKVTIGRDVHYLLQELRYFKSEYMALKNLLSLNDEKYIKELKKKIKSEILQSDAKTNKEK